MSRQWTVETIAEFGPMSTICREAQEEVCDVEASLGSILIGCDHLVYPKLHSRISATVDEV